MGAVARASVSLWRCRLDLLSHCSLIGLCLPLFAISNSTVFQRLYIMRLWQVRFGWKWGLSYPVGCLWCLPHLVTDGALCSMHGVSNLPTHHWQQEQNQRRVPLRHMCSSKRYAARSNTSMAGIDAVVPRASILAADAPARRLDVLPLEGLRAAVDGTVSAGAIS